MVLTTVRLGSFAVEIMALAAAAATIFSVLLRPWVGVVELFVLDAVVAFAALVESMSVIWATVASVATWLFSVRCSMGWALSAVSVT